MIKNACNAAQHLLPLYAFMDYIATPLHEQEEILRHLSSVLNTSKYKRSGTYTQCNNSVVLIHP